MMHKTPVLHDPLIVDRVRTYLEDNVDQKYLDVTQMAKSLQVRYPEYTRRKLVPFRALVEGAYRVVLRSYGMDTGLSSDSDISDIELADDSSSNTGNNTMNNLMSNLYSKTKSPAGNPVSKPSAMEAIDISSEDSDVEAASNANGTTNAAATTKAFRELAPSKLQNATTSATIATQVAVVNKVSNTAVKSTATKFQEAISKKRQSSPAPLPMVKKTKTEATNRSLLQPPKKKYKKEIILRKSRETFRNVGGMESTLRELCELLLHIKLPDVYFVLGLMPPRGILLHGPSGCGKTMLARATAGQLKLPLIEVVATEFIAGVSGESEERIRDVFEQAAACGPCVLFIDEIDAISSNRSMAQKDMERRVVSQLISCLDDLKTNENGQSVLVIGATTRPDVLDPALRRMGRFDQEFAIGIPNRKGRKDILSLLCDGLNVEPRLDFDKIAELTPGYVGADLLALVTRAATIATKKKFAEQIRLLQENAQRNITIVDLDDDGDGNEEPNDVQSILNNSIEENTKSDVNVNDEKTTENESEADKPKPEAAVEIKPDEEDISKSDKALTNETDKSKPDEDKPMDVDEVVSINEVSKEVVKEGDSDDAKKSDENAQPDKSVTTAPLPNDEQPSLLKLLNWLDNPPEDFDFGCSNDFRITLNDFLEAVKLVQPSAKREGFITVPDITWNDVGSLQDIREELKLAVLAPVKYPERLEQLGITAPSGVLLCGPPGCGKTLLAKAVANEAGINFISVKGPELMNMYVGESERAVRVCFQRARNSAPCVIFFDEFDSLCPKRSDSNEGGSGTRIVNQLLTEMDGVEDRRGVYILAATNRPDIIDPAILRPGRLDTILYVGMPQKEDREEILQATTKNGKRPLLADDVNFTKLAQLTDGYTGADLAGLVRQAAMLALKESLTTTEPQLDDLRVNNEHFERAMTLLRPSVTAKDREMYEKLRLKYAAPRAPDVILGRE